MTVTVGLVGAGGIGQTHARNLHDTKGATVAGVCDLDADSAQTLAASVDANSYTDYRALLEGEDVDAVYVCTPPRARVDVIRDAAEDGLAIFCEKPLAATLEDGREIARLVDEHDVPFMVGFCLRFSEPVEELRAVVERGELGDPVSLFSTRAGWGVPDGDNWRTDSEQACGVTVESASHNVDLLRWLGGEITAASGETTNVSHPSLESFDDNVAATLRFESGAIGSIRNSWTSHVEYFRHGVVGTEGTAVLEGEGWWRLDRLTVVEGTPAPAATESDAQTDPDERVVEFDAETATDMGYRGETEAFVECVANGTSPPVGVIDALRALQVSEAIHSSASERVGECE